MPKQDIPPITPLKWVSNLLEVAGGISDREMQKERWSTRTWNIWEHPDELINTVDDYVLDGFIEAFATTFTQQQCVAVSRFRDDYEGFCSSPSATLDPNELLVDTQWERLRRSSDAFIAAFQQSWPQTGRAEEAEVLLQAWLRAYAARSKG